MRRSSRHRLFLLLLVAALVAAAALQWRHDRSQLAGALLPIDPASVSRIVLQLGHAPAEHYEKRAGHWWRTDGKPLRSDDGRVGELAATAAAPVLQWRPLSDFRPARIGLDPPAAVLTLDGQTLAFGDTSATGPQLYVRVGDRVALISSRFTPRSPPDQTVQAP